MNSACETILTRNSIRLWYRPHSSEQRPIELPVLVVVTWKWLGWPGTTSRLNSNGMIQKAWMTSTEIRLNRTVE